MAATYEPIASTTLGSDAASVTFGSGGTLPQTFTDLKIVIAGTFVSTAVDDIAIIRLNADTGTNYSHTELFGTGSSASSSRGTSKTGLFLWRMGKDQISTCVVNLLSYSNGSVYKTAISETAATERSRIYRTVALWQNTSAVTSLTILENGGNDWKSGTTFSLYGIKAA